MNQELDVLAAAATPGPWNAVGQVVGAGKHRIADTQDVCCYGHSGQECSDEEMERLALADAAFIAACDPDTIRALIRERDEAVRELREAIQTNLRVTERNVTDQTDFYRGKASAFRVVLSMLDGPPNPTFVCGRAALHHKDGTS